MSLLKKAIPGRTGNLIRGGGFTDSEVQELKADYEKAIKAFKGDTVVSQDHEIYVTADKPGGLNVKAGLLAMLKALDEFGMRNHLSLSTRDGVLTQIQDAGQYNRLDEGLFTPAKKAPYKFKGFAALSVDTQKYFSAPCSIDILTVSIVFSILTSISRIKVKGSFSLRTCFNAERLRT